MKILVMGAEGMLGRKVMDVFGEAGHSVVGTDRMDTERSVAADVTRLDEVRSVIRRTMPHVIVNCAAYTAVDACEKNREQAFRVNAIGARNAAIAGNEVNADIIHVSTDYVFDGTKDGAYDEFDATCPRSVYGQSKLAGEDLVRQLSTRWTICRTQWLYGEHGPNFAQTMLKLADDLAELKVVSDQHGCPTYTGDLARQLLILAQEKAYGLYHVSGGGQTTWHGFARAILDRDGRADYPVNECTTEDFPRPAPRPANSVMRNLALEMSIGDSMRPWEQGLDEFMEKRRAAAETD